MRTIARAVRGAATVLLAGAILVPVTGTIAFADPGNGNGGGNGKAHSSTGASSDCGEYCSTRDGSPSRNGNGDGESTGRPCAGCVGKADDKNPPGQYPNGSDANNGYECDGNSGIARTNPAHTGCTTPDAVAAPVVAPVAAPVAAPKIVAQPAVKADGAQVAGTRLDAAKAAVKAPAELPEMAGDAIGTDVLGTRFARPVRKPSGAGSEGSLPHTGGSAASLLVAAAALVVTGVVVTRTAAKA